MIVFIDYISIYSKNENKHENHFRLALQILKEHQLYAKFKKYEVWLRSFASLGHVIFCKGVDVDLKKMDVVRNQPRPLNPIDIRSFLGLVGHYRRFFYGFSSTSSPLTAFTKNKVKLEWSEACEIGFQDLKDNLSSAQVLTLLEGNEGFVVYCDASRVGLGCVLKQHGEVRAMPLGNSKFMIRIISNDLELAAVVFA